MISINQAAAQGVAQLRKPKWSNPDDHIRIDIIDGRAGPWLHFYSPINEAINGRNPVDMLELEGRDEECFEPYLPLPEPPAGGGK